MFAPVCVPQIEHARPGAARPLTAGRAVGAKQRRVDPAHPHLGLVAGPPRALGHPPDRLVQLAIGVPRLPGGPFAQHECAVLAAGQLTDLPQPSHSVLHFVRAPRPGDCFGERGHGQSDGPGGEQRLWMCSRIVTG